MMNPSPGMIAPPGVVPTPLPPAPVGPPRRTIYVSNLASPTTDENLKELFSPCGDVDKVKIMGNPSVGLFAFVQFSSHESASKGVAMADTEFLGKPIKITLASSDVIPGDVSIPSRGEGPPIRGMITNIRTHSSTHAQKAEEVARTIYIGNVNGSVTAEMLMNFFAVCGPISFCRLGGDESHPSRFAFIEFAELAGANAALRLNGTILIDRPLKVNHSKNPIVKPPQVVDPRAESKLARRLRRIADRINRKCLGDDEAEEKSARSASRSPDGRGRDTKRRRSEESRSRDRDRRSSRRDRSSSRDRSNSRDRSESDRSPSRERRGRDEQQNASHVSSDGPQDGERSGDTSPRPASPKAPE